MKRVYGVVQPYHGLNKSTLDTEEDFKNQKNDWLGLLPTVWEFVVLQSNSGGNFCNPATFRWQSVI